MQSRLLKVLRSPPGKLICEMHAKKSSTEINDTKLKINDGLCSMCAILSYGLSQDSKVNNQLSNKKNYVVQKRTLSYFIKQPA